MSKGLLATFEKNPLAWILAGLLAFSVYSHYRTGSEFTETCSAYDELRQGYLDSSDLDAAATAPIIDEDSREGREYRWRYSLERQLEEICGNRLAPGEWYFDD